MKRCKTRYKDGKTSSALRTAHCRLVLALRTARWHGHHPQHTNSATWKSRTISICSESRNAIQAWIAPLSVANCELARNENWDKVYPACCKTQCTANQSSWSDTLECPVSHNEIKCLNWGTRWTSLFLQTSNSD